MEYLIVNIYVENKGKGNLIHSDENILLGERRAPKSLRIQNQVIYDSKIGRNQKVIRNQKDELEFKSYLKKIIKKVEKAKIDVGYPQCKSRSRIEFHKEFYSQNYELISFWKNQIQKYLDKLTKFSTRLPYAIRKIREIYFAMMNTEFRTIEDMIIELQNLEGKTKVRFHQNLSDY